MVLDQLRRPADQHVARGAPHLDQIVGDQAVPAHDEIERRLRLADAALAQQQHAHAQHVHQHGVDAGGRRQLQLQVLLDAGRSPPTTPAASAAAAPPRRSAASRSMAGTSSPLVTTTQAGFEAEERFDRRARRLLGQRLQVRDLGRAQHLHPLGVDLPDVPRQRQPGLLDALHGDAAPEPRLAGQQHQPQPRALRRAATGPSASASSTLRLDYLGPLPGPPEYISTWRLPRR